tara:strand:+ start:169 stop:729 length:561 start_codon:yes stop_codon:yes gene_type:complete
MYNQRPSKINKLLVGSLGIIFGLSHFALIQSAVNKKSNLPIINLPVGPYTTYQVDASEFGYKISYMANDPKVLNSIKRSEIPKGFFGNKKEKIVISKEFTMNGEIINSNTPEQGSGPTDKEIACYKIEGSGESTGKLVGASVGVKAAPVVSNIPIIGWLAAGWVAMFGQDKGAEIGGQIAQDFNDC